MSINGLDFEKICSTGYSGGDQITQETDPDSGVDGWEESLDDEDEVEGKLESLHGVEDSLQTEVFSQSTLLLSNIKLLHSSSNLDRNVTTSILSRILLVSSEKWSAVIL